MPLILASLCGSTPYSYKALIRWFVIELWPQPAHRVVGSPLYTSRVSPIKLTLMSLLFRDDRRHAFGLEQRVDDGVRVDRHAVVMGNRFQPLHEVRRQLG